MPSFLERPIESTKGQTITAEDVKVLTLDTLKVVLLKEVSIVAEELKAIKQDFRKFNSPLTN